VRGEVVHNQVELLLRWLRQHQVLEKSDELGAGVARGRLAKDLSAGRIQSRVKRERSMPVILKAVPLGPARRKRQHRVQPIQSLNGGLFIDAEDRRVGGRMQIEANDLRCLGLKVRVIADHVVAQSVRLQPIAVPDSDHRHVGSPELPCQATGAPLRAAVIGAAPRPLQNPGFQLRRTFGFGTRGIGLPAKIHAYKLQEEGLDTVEANIKLGFAPELRDYGIGAQILADLGVRKMRFLSNNPKKVVGLEAYGLKIVEMVPIKATANPHNAKYLETKRLKMGHLL